MYWNSDRCITLRFTCLFINLLFKPKSLYRSSSFTFWSWFLTCKDVCCGCVWCSGCAWCCGCVWCSGCAWCRGCVWCCGCVWCSGCAWWFFWNIGLKVVIFLSCFACDAVDCFDMAGAKVLLWALLILWWWLLILLEVNSV